MEQIQGQLLPQREAGAGARPRHPRAARAMLSADGLRVRGAWAPRRAAGLELLWERRRPLCFLPGQRIPADPGGPGTRKEQSASKRKVVGGG